MGKSKVSRRTVLKVGVGAASVAALSAVGIVTYCDARLNGEAGEGGSPGDVLARALETVPGAKRVGELYLQEHPEEADPSVLLARIFEVVDPEAPRCRATGLSALREASRRDFREGRTVQLEGWMMGLTELRVCALVVSRETGDLPSA